MPKLTSNVYLVDHSTGKPHLLLKGQEVPEFALPRLDESYYTSDAVKAEPAKAAEPAGNASLADWQAYARSQGASDDDIEDATRDELREKFGGK